MSFNFTIPTPEINARASSDVPVMDIEEITRRAEQQQSPDVRADLFSLIHEVKRLRQIASDG